MSDEWQAENKIEDVNYRVFKFMINEVQRLAETIT